MLDYLQNELVLSPLSTDVTKVEERYPGREYTDIFRTHGYIHVRFNYEAKFTAIAVAEPWLGMSREQYNEETRVFARTFEEHLGWSVGGSTKMIVAHAIRGIDVKVPLKCLTELERLENAKFTLSPYEITAGGTYKNHRFIQSIEKDGRTILRRDR